MAFDNLLDEEMDYHLKGLQFIQENGSTEITESATQEFKEAVTASIKTTEKLLEIIVSNRNHTPY